MTQQDIITWGGAALVPVLASLVAGRTLRRILLLPFEYWARRSKNTIDDQIVADAEKDLGIEPTKFDGDSDAHK